MLSLFNDLLTIKAKYIFRTNRRIYSRTYLTDYTYLVQKFILKINVLKCKYFLTIYNDKVSLKITNNEEEQVQ